MARNPSTTTTGGRFDDATTGRTGRARSRTEQKHGLRSKHQRSESDVLEISNSDIAGGCFALSAHGSLPESKPLRTHPRRLRHFRHLLRAGPDHVGHPLLRAVRRGRYEGSDCVSDATTSATEGGAEVS